MSTTTDDVIETSDMIVIRKDDVLRRLARISDAHRPYNDTLDKRTGMMCRECGYLDPCPTRRMADLGDPDGPWLQPDDER